VNLVALDRALDEEDAAVADRDAVEQREGGGRQFLVGEEQSQHEAGRQLGREAMLLLLLAHSSQPAHSRITSALRSSAVR